MFGEHDVDESEVREAVDYYTKEGNKELKKITDDIRTMFIGFGGTACITFIPHTTRHMEINYKNSYVLKSTQIPPPPLMFLFEFFLVTLECFHHNLN